MPRYYTGAVTTQESLAQAVDTVLTDGAAGGLNWTQDELDLVNDEAGWNDGTNYWQMDWDNSADIRTYQSTAWDGAGTAPGSHTGDSGSDHTTNAIGNAMVAYHAFTNNQVGVDYAHFVVEYETDHYRHFGFGLIDKFGGWTGGAYCYGGRWDQGGGIDTPNGGSHSVLFDGGLSITVDNATIKMVGTEWPNAPTNCIWGTSTSTGGGLGNDGDGDGRYRCQGASRRSMYSEFYLVKPDAASEYVPGGPVVIIAKDDTGTFPVWMKMGAMPNVFVGNMENFAAEAVKDFGGQDWMVFPFIRDAYTVSSGVEQSGNGGIWYRRT